MRFSSPRGSPRWVGGRDRWVLSKQDGDCVEQNPGKWDGMRTVYLANAICDCRNVLETLVDQKFPDIPIPLPYEMGSNQVPEQR